MYSVDMKLIRLADSQDSRFQVWKGSYIDRAALQCGKFADY